MRGLATYIGHSPKDAAARSFARDIGGGVAHPGGDGQGDAIGGSDCVARGAGAGGNSGGAGGGLPARGVGRPGGDDGGRPDGAEVRPSDDIVGLPGYDEGSLPGGDDGGRTSGDQADRGDAPGHEPTGGKLDHPGLDAHSRRRLMDLFPAEQAAISVLLADEPRAAFIAAGEAQTTPFQRVKEVRGTQAGAH